MYIHTLVCLCLLLPYVLLALYHERVSPHLHSLYVHTIFLPLISSHSLTLSFSLYLSFCYLTLISRHDNTKTTWCILLWTTLTLKASWKWTLVKVVDERFLFLVIDVKNIVKGRRVTTLSSLYRSFLYYSAMFFQGII